MINNKASIIDKSSVDASRYNAVQFKVESIPATIKGGFIGELCMTLHYSELRVTNKLVSAYVYQDCSDCTAVAPIGSQHSQEDRSL